jgi:hypothetical protein
MSKIEHDRPDWNRGNTFVTLGEAQDRVIADAVKAARAEQMAVLGASGGPVGVPVGETTMSDDDSWRLYANQTIRQLTDELVKARLVTANALADVAAARNALALSIQHQDIRHTEAMKQQRERHDAKVAELDAMIMTLVGKLTQSRKDHAAVRPVAASLDTIEWGWHAPAGLLPRGMR